MTMLEWILAVLLFTVYVAAIFTVAHLTFKKGHLILGFLGILFPILWLVGAVLPAKRGSRAWIEEQERQRFYVDIRSS